MQVATLAHSPFLGRIAVGRIYAGTIRRGQQAVVCRQDGGRDNFRVSQLMTFKGLERIDTDEASAGDIIALAGAGDATVGDTICLAATPLPLPAIAIVPWFFAGSLFPIAAMPVGLTAFAKVLPITHVLALLRYGIADPSGQGLHDIWGMSNTTAMAALSLAVVLGAALLMTAVSIRVFRRSATV